jgi:outer membrane protein assembly factor BamB
MQHAYPLLRHTLLALACTPLLANAQLSPAWTAETGPVQWMRTTAAGALVACTGTGLKGIDPSTGAVAWTIAELANVAEEGYAEVERSPFITLVPAGHPEDLFIVEPFSGTVAFSSEAAGISNITSKYFLYANNVIVLAGQKADKTAAMACVDMGTGTVRWTKDDSFSRITACNSAGPDAFLLCTFAYIYKLDAATGQELWKKAPNPEAEKMSAGMGNLMALMDKNAANLNIPGVSGLFVTSPNAPDLCFIGMQNEQRKEITDAQGKKTVTLTYSTFVNAFRIGDGSYAWSAPLTMPQKLGTIVPLKAGLLVGAGDTRSVDLLDYASGAGKWGKNGKGINVKGILAGAVQLGERTLLTSGGEDGVITLVDAMGVEVWKKPAKLDGVVRSVKFMGGDVLVATEQEADLIDLSTGLSRLEKPLPGGAGLVASGPSDTYVFNTKDGLLYAVPASGGSARAVSTVPVAFEGKEKPTRLEHTEAGLVLSSDQNLALLGADGSAKYRKYFPAPRESGLVRALKYASAVRAAYYTAAFGYTSAAFGNAAQNIQVTDANSANAKELAGDLSTGFADLTQQAGSATKRFWQEAGARFKASSTTNDIHFVMTESGKGSYALKALHKHDGGEAATIPLGSDKSPRYEVDGITNAVYLVDGTAVTCYRP